jgi:hypothetical protein
MGSKLRGVCKNQCCCKKSNFMIISKQTSNLEQLSLTIVDEFAFLCKPIPKS